MGKDSREKIIAAATETFSRYGYDKTTVEDIAVAAEKAKTSLYYYFDSKAAILKAVAAEIFKNFMEQLDRFRNLTPNMVVDSFRGYLKKRMEIVVASPLYSQLALKGFSERSSEAVRIMMSARDNFDRWEKEYFHAVCAYGKQVGVFSGDIDPEIFSDMLGMLLKGVEAEFLISKDRDAATRTYEGMVDFLTKNRIQEQ